MNVKMIPSRLWIVLAMLSFAGVSSVLADTHYVSLTGSNLWPYASWESAARNVQDAVDTSVSGDTIMIGDGHYYLTQQITVSKTLTIQSANGASVTIIDGNYPASTNRCFYFNTTTFTLRGLTITKGYASASDGGGIYIIGTSLINGLIDNCNFVANTAGNNGGGGYRLNGGSSTLTISSCTFSNNSANFPACSGGGFCGSAFFDHCIFSDNIANYHGGGVSGGNLRNCLIVRNTSSDGSGVTSATLVENCTIVSNNAILGSAVDALTNLNCIIVRNVRNGTTPDANHGSGVYKFCCTTPQVPDANGDNNFTLDPGFVNIGSNDFHLATGSQCINTGSNVSWMSSATDLGGNPRLFSGIVDRGAYEAPSNSTPVNAVTVDIGLGVELTWNSQAGIQYLIQASNDLTDTNNWSIIDQRTGNGGEMNAIYSAKNQPYRFFRVIAGQ